MKQEPTYFSNRDLQVIYASMIVRLSQLGEKYRAVGIGWPEIAQPIVDVCDELSSVIIRVERELNRRGCNPGEVVGCVDQRDKDYPIQ